MDSGEKPKFRIIKDFKNPDLPLIEAFLKDHQIDIAGMEFITDEQGNRFVYDINTNTNYNGDAEKATDYQWKGMRTVAEYLVAEFRKKYPQV